MAQVIRDEHGYEWFGYQEQTIPEEAVRVGDPGQGQQRIIRIFSITLPPDKENQTALETYKKTERWIKETLFASGLTTDDNHEPKAFKKGKYVSIIVVAKPSGSKIPIHDGLKHNQGYVADVKGLKIVTHKSEFVDLFLKGTVQDGKYS